MGHRFFVFVTFTIYIFLMTALMIWQGIGIAPDRYAFVLLLPALLFRRTRTFILDWIPFLFILLSYDFLRGLAPFLNNRVHYMEPIQFDRLFFGEIPTLTLQHALYNAGQLHWYDFLATIFYFLHFALPLSFGFLIWLFNREKFRQFISGLLILSYGGWVTYVLYPASPPWLSAQKGFLPGVAKILDQTLKAFPERFQLPSIYHDFNPNQVAAIPSMHAAYPFLVLLFAVSFFGKKALWFTPYVLGVWFSIVYLGEHYVVDIIVGVIYAVISFVVAKYLLHRVKFHPWPRKRIASQ